jgi:hypothetical protein
MRWKGGTTMETSHGHVAAVRTLGGSATLERAEPARQAYQILHVAYFIAPVIAGLDKFFHLLTDWDKYLSPFVSNLLGGNGHTFMLAVGVVEVIAGIGVLVKPKIFAYVVGFWLLGIVGNLILAGDFYDIALRDFGLALGAFALARLSRAVDRS